MIKLIKSINIKLDSIICKKEEIDDSDLDGEKVMMNLDKGQYFMMNSVGSRIWEIINEPISLRDIICILVDEYDITPNKCEGSLKKFIKELWESELISFK